MVANFTVSGSTIVLDKAVVGTACLPTTAVVVLENVQTFLCPTTAAVNHTVTFTINDGGSVKSDHATALLAATQWYKQKTGNDCWHQQTSTDWRGNRTITLKGDGCDKRWNSGASFWLDWQEFAPTAGNNLVYPEICTGTIRSEAYTRFLRWGETPDQQQARIESEKKHRQERAAAEARAEELLRRYLSEEQKAQLAKNNKFIVRSQSGQLYEVNRGRAGNVYRLDPLSRQPVERFCIHPEANVPDSDTMLSQKVMIEVDEVAFVRTANRSKVAA